MATARDLLGLAFGWPVHDSSDQVLVGALVEWDPTYGDEYAEYHAQ